VTVDQLARLGDLLVRLEQHRKETDRQYNTALTALDECRPATPDAPPAPPSAYDASRLPEANRTWDLPLGEPSTPDGSITGRLRARVWRLVTPGFVWRVIGPALTTQRHFNATIVDHLNRNVAAHEEIHRATEDLIARVTAHIEGRFLFEARLLDFLQTVTGYIENKDREVRGHARADAESLESRVNALNAGLGAVADSWLKRWESLGAREERFTRRLSTIDDVRATAVAAQQAALSLKRDVETLLRATPASGTAGAAAPPAAPDLDAFKYLGFEDQFRGSPEDISRRLGDYVALFRGHSDILDIGCGRGEFLELLRAGGISARGIDLNHAMVEACRRRGLQVDEGDALSFLEALPDGSLGGIFGAQLAEHLAPDYLARLLETAAHKLRPGGMVVLETINPACWLAFFESYIRDLTHVRPLHPETLQYLLRVSGFHDVRVEYKSPVAEAERLQPIAVPETALPPALADVIQAFNENVARLNGRLFTFQDYAAIARK
jgi:O-antigen chain-terminating methyltransferase